MAAADCDILAGAVRRDDLEEVRGVLSRGVSPDARDGDAPTPLMHARSAAMAELLVSAGADMYATTRYGIRCNDEDALDAAIEELRTWQRIAGDDAPKRGFPERDNTERKGRNAELLAQAREVVALIQAATPGPPRV